MRFWKKYFPLPDVPEHVTALRTSQMITKQLIINETQNKSHFSASFLSSVSVIIGSLRGEKEKHCIVCGGLVFKAPYSYDILKKIPIINS